MTKAGQRKKAGHNLKVTTLTMSLKQKKTKVRRAVPTFAFPTTQQSNISQVILRLCAPLATLPSFVISSSRCSLAKPGVWNLPRLCPSAVPL